MDLVNRLEQEQRGLIRTGSAARQLTQVDFVVIDELGYLPFSQTGGALLFHLGTVIGRRRKHHRGGTGEEGLDLLQGRELRVVHVDHHGLMIGP